jgi:hypothetical protein
MDLNHVFEMDVKVFLDERLCQEVKLTKLYEMLALQIFQEMFLYSEILTEEMV